MLRFHLEVLREQFLDVRRVQKLVCTVVQFDDATVFVSGAFQGPKDIPQSVVDSSAAASAAGEILTEARNSLTKTAEVIPETNVSNERPRIGVFVCRCGINIAGVVDVPSVAEYAATLPYVEYTDDNLYSCSQDQQEAMAERARKRRAHRLASRER